MAITLGNANLQSLHSATADQSTIVFGPLTQAAGDFALLLYVACDNFQTTDGDEWAVTGITDASGNVWKKAGEWCNGQGASQAGVTCSVWFLPRVALAYSAHNITVNLSNNTARDATSAVAASFGIGAGNHLVVEGSAGLSDDAADPSSLDVNTANVSCLRVRAIGSESATSTALTKTAAFTGTLGTALPGTVGVLARAEYAITTGTGLNSDPTLFAADHASVYVAFREVPVGKALPPFSKAMRFFSRRF